MKISITVQQKILIIVIFFIVAVIGFMIKLPSIFRHYDKELHASFYFLAAVFFNVLLEKMSFLKNIIIFILLFVFGIFIEFSQAYSNKFFHKRIHGRFDPEDVQWNLYGLLTFLILWLIFSSLKFIYKKIRFDNITN